MTSQIFELAPIASIHEHAYTFIERSNMWADSHPTDAFILSCVCGAFALHAFFRLGRELLTFSGILEPKISKVDDALYYARMNRQKRV